MDDLKKLIFDLAKLIINPTARVNIMSTDDLSSYVDPSPYFGEACERILRDIPKEQKDTISYIRGKCIDFVLKLISELKQRLPENIDLLENIKELSVDRCLRAQRNNFLCSTLLEKLGIPISNLENLEVQWQTLSNVTWQNIVSKDSLKFWFEVYEYTNANGEKTYQELAMFAFTVLSLPLSNASVERVFSFLNIIKSKLRNRLLISTVDAIIMIRTGLWVKGKNCYNYQLPDNVICSVGSAEKYENKRGNEAVEDEWDTIADIFETSNEELETF